MKNTTTGLLESLLQTLDTQEFIAGVQEFDRVTQRQCFLKALKQLRKADTIRLHGQEGIKNAVQKIRDAMESEVAPMAN
jgi:hypothetical protein